MKESGRQLSVSVHRCIVLRLLFDNEAIAPLKTAQAIC